MGPGPSRVDIGYPLDGDRTSTAAEVEARRAAAYVAGRVAERLRDAIDDEADPVHRVLPRDKGGGSNQNMAKIKNQKGPKTDF